MFGLIAAAVLALDQLTKYIVESGMRLHESIPVVGGLFSITYVRNPGAAFGFLAESHPMFRTVFFIGITVAAIVLIFYYIRKYASDDVLPTVSLALIMGGAVGNLIDRVRFGEVIDFLDFYIGPHHWPAFNVADSAISIGAVLLLVQMLRKKKE